MENREFRFNLNVVYADGTKETIADAETDGSIIERLIRNPPPDVVQGALTRNRDNVWLYFPVGTSQGNMFMAGYGGKITMPVTSKNQIVNNILNYFPELEDLGLPAGGVGAASYDGGRRRRGRRNTRRNRKNRRNSRRTNRR